MRYHAPKDYERESFHRGSQSEAYRFLGAHPGTQNGKAYWHFAVWAPNAAKVCLTGEFCGWSTDAYPMQKQYDGIWELRLDAGLFSVQAHPELAPYPEAQERLRAYKYAVTSQSGEMHLKADPYAFAAELRPNTASLLCDLDGYAWQDQKWMRRRKKTDTLREPVNIYEMHLGTWRRSPDGSFLSYGEIADQLIPYLTDLHYTHVELLPVMEHPLDGSWGYQVTGYYSPNSRYGSPHDFMRFVDRMHAAGIGVILDWVPAHFPRDEIGLRRFDGTPCYEHADLRRSDMGQWGTVLFDYARGEVCSFLLSNACFWLKKYHADGLRCDAVSAMLYHDFCRDPGAWLPNRFGGNENLEAADFLRRLNTVCRESHPGIMMIAEESSAYPKVTGNPDQGGLGFTFKWNMGWMNDILSYIALDPVYRKYHHNKLTFSLMYAFSEHYVLPFSHDEVVHGKHSMLDKQPGDIWQKFAGLRALYGYMLTHPGKKLLFMGGEFGQFVEWRDSEQLDWFLLGYERHPEMLRYVRELNLLYRSHPALWRADDSWDGFRWISVDDADRSVLVYLRSCPEETLLCCVNFTPVVYRDYQIGMPYAAQLEEILCSDREEYAGSGQYNGLPVRTEPVPCGAFGFSASVLLPPLGFSCFSVNQISDKEDSNVQ